MLRPPSIRQYLLAALFILATLGLRAQLTLRVTSLPDNTPNGSTLHAAGSFNNWNPADNNFTLSEEDGVWTISLDVAPGSYEYKFTRGSWATVEGSTEGGFRPNRSVDYAGGTQTVDLTIDGWEDQAGSNSTASANVEILAEDFFMPQLNRNRRIHIYLPPDYYTNDRSYPVLYMHDGQNLFDAATSFSGEWEVDESLNTLFDNGDQGVIIIGINNGGADRINEYTPWANPTYGGGQGSAYVDFLVETLKPYVDDNFRTLADANHTGIMGSSLGGLISLYAGIRHQDVFGKVGVLSPSLWFTDDIYDFVSSTGRQAPLKIALLGGELESATLVAELNEMYNTLRTAGFTTSELSLVTHADGQHSEWYWRREFPATYEWLFDNITLVDASPALMRVRLWPNPTRDQLRIEGLPAADGSWRAQVYDMQRKPLQSDTLRDGQLPIAQLPSGSYLLYLYNQQAQWALLRFQKI
ncbi:MAG: alpha/beta hydrolase-fold protein [Bacteroidota bacterium]